MSENQIIIGLLALLAIAVAVVAAEIYRLNDKLAPILNSSVARGIASF